jgi:hypothetical protein
MVNVSRNIIQFSLDIVTVFQMTLRCSPDVIAHCKCIQGHVNMYRGLLTSQLLEQLSYAFSCTLYNLRVYVCYRMDNFVRDTDKHRFILLKSLLCF